MPKLGTVSLLASGAGLLRSTVRIGSGFVTSGFVTSGLAGSGADFGISAFGLACGSAFASSFNPVSLSGAIIFWTASGCAATGSETGAALAATSAAGFSFSTFGVCTLAAEACAPFDEPGCLGWVRRADGLPAAGFGGVWGGAAAGAGASGLVSAGALAFEGGT